MEELVKRWRCDLDCLKDSLYDIGDKGDSLAYNIKAAEALAIANCIIDLQSALLAGEE